MLECVYELLHKSSSGRIVHGSVKYMLCSIRLFSHPVFPVYDAVNRAIP
jgi:hypothetical protein